LPRLIRHGLESPGESGYISSSRDEEEYREHVVTIFDLRKAYHCSLDNIRGWLGDTDLSGQLTVLDRLLARVTPPTHGM